MSIEDIRRSRGVPAKRGMRVEFDGKPGRIVSTHGGYLMVVGDCGRRWTCHPTWRMTYMLADGTKQEFGRDE